MGRLRKWTSNSTTAYSSTAARSERYSSAPTGASTLYQLRFPSPGANLADRAAVEIAAFGGPIPDNDYGDLIGDITDNATIVVYFNAQRLDGTCPITIRAKAEGVFSSVVRIYTAPRHVEYSDCTVVNQGQGTGPQIFKLLADTAKRLGFPHIKAEGRKHVSTQNPQTNCFGHYVYAKLGFNALIPGNAPGRPA